MAPKPKPTPKYRTKTRSQLDESAASTKYSPKPMSAVDKRAAGFRGAITQDQINQRKREMAIERSRKPASRKGTAGKATVAAIAKRFGVTAREARDIATAVSTVIKTSSASGAGKQYAVKNLKTQIKETAKAATTGKKGTRSGETMPTTDRGNMYIDPIYAKLRKKKR